MVLLTPDFLNWKSHLNKTLIQHTEGVRDKAIVKYDSPIVRVGSCFHDVGKLNPNFPKHLLHLPLACDDYKNHAYLSFLVFFNWCKAKFHSNLLSHEDIIACAMCIAKHHGSLVNIEDIIGETKYDGASEWERMTAFLATNPTMFVDQMLAYFGLIQDPVNLLLVPLQVPFTKTKVVLQDPLGFYFNTRMSFSAIVTADKQDAGGYPQENVKLRKQFFKRYESQLDKHMATLGKKPSPLNGLRNDIRQYSRERLQTRLNLGQRVFSLTCPTGSGKTLMLLYLALDILKKTGQDLKIIYAVPFLSITEQVFDLCSKIFYRTASGLRRIDSKSDPEDDSHAISHLKKLMKKFIKKVAKVEWKEDDQKILDEGFFENTFDYPFITTTFVQLFEAFTTRSNKGLMKYSNLRNCIFLVDELQALPPRLYTFFTAMIDEHCRRNNCYAILSTATMPCFDISHQKEALKLFSHYQVPEELSDLAFYDNPIFDRYEIVVRQNNMQIKDLVADIAGQVKSCLVILNTIRDSKEVYQYLKAISNCKVVLLNSHFYSDARTEKLNQVKGLLESNQRVILVTTQLIEAGVDIDFPVVYRDIAPLPNIIQAAGRCNRNGRYEKGSVIVFQLYDEKRLRASYIYNGLDAPFLDFAITTFYKSGKSTFSEKDLIQDQQKFFNSVAANTKFGFWSAGSYEDPKNRRNFVQLIQAGMFGTIGEFKIIPPEHYGKQYRFYVPESKNDHSFDQLIQYGLDILQTDESNEEGDKLRKIFIIKNKQKRLLRKMSRRMVQTLISEDLDLTPYVTSTTVYLNMYELKPKFYDEELGLDIT